jgi:hypothetical protein
MRQSRCSSLYDDWGIDEQAGVYVSPLADTAPEQILVFSDWLKNGSVSFDITPVKGNQEHWGEAREGAVVLRYAAPNQYYYAGIGGFSGKFFIGKTVLPGPNFLSLGTVGQLESIKYGQKHHLRVECSGNRITLFENEVNILSVLDETYISGQVGFRCWKTSCRYESISIVSSKPLCFVIMPFATELDFVYETIKTAVEKQGLICRRADERFVAKPLIDDIKELIAGADLIIVDFTGRNPNVYYEAGLADAWTKKWVVLAQSPADLTFDVRHIRTIFYSNSMGADVKLREDLARAIREAFGSGHPEYERSPDNT